MFNKWLHIRILDAGVVLGEDRLHLYANLKGWMALLFIPLKDCLSNLHFDMVQGEVSMNFFAFCFCSHICMSAWL